MQLEVFYETMRHLHPLPPAERHAAFADLHRQALAEYTGAVSRLDAAGAACPSSDGRSLAAVIGHIAEWERFMILSCGEMLAGVEKPQMLHGLRGWLAPDGTAQAFENIDDFNAFQLARQISLPWAEIQSTALSAASTLYALFTTPGLLDAARLEGTAPARQRMPDGTKLPMRAGWVIWWIVIEHEAAEHAADLGI